MLLLLLLSVIATRPVRGPVHFGAFRTHTHTRTRTRRPIMHRSRQRSGCSVQPPATTVTTMLLLLRLLLTMMLLHCGMFGFMLANRSSSGHVRGWIIDHILVVCCFTLHTNSASLFEGKPFNDRYCDLPLRLFVDVLVLRRRVTNR